MTDLSNLDNFLLQSYCDKINEFVGEEIIKTIGGPDKDVKNFLEKLSNAIHRHNQMTCCRKCFFRKKRRKNEI